MSRTPLISIVTPFLDCERFLEASVESVLAQTCDGWELLLIDDGSVDNGPELARRFERQYSTRVRCLRQAGGGHWGVSAARNLGLRAAKGHYVTFLDADDVYLPRKLEQQVAALESHAVDVTYGKTEYWNSWAAGAGGIDLDSVPELGVPLDTVVDPPALLIHLYPLGGATAPSLNAVMLTRATALRLGGFEDRFRIAYSDQSLLVKIYLAERIFISGECCDRYRQHASSSSAVVERSGRYLPIRRAFLAWFSEYLAEARRAPPAVRVALDEAIASAAAEGGGGGPGLR